jgi:hypothetical protein
MISYRIILKNLDGLGPRRVRVYDMPVVEVPTKLGGKPVMMAYYWASITDRPCPAGCGGTVRWAEAGYVPGYRICDGCGRHYLAGGTADAPTLMLMVRRRKTE